MFQDKPEWIAHQRRRWLRPDAARWFRPDAHRWMTPEAQRWLLPDGKHAAVPQPSEPLDLTALEYTRENLLRLRDEIASLRAELKFQQLFRSLKAGFDPNQPRVPAGNPDGGQWIGAVTEGSETSPTIRFAGVVIRICLAGSRALSTDAWGNRSYWVEYQCTGGRSFVRRGVGHRYPTIVLDPFQ